ncbi:hypothetical protein BHE74_00037312 [Ensete ventricosum]|nr:hypothetical protein GW17_00044025 [Ensete ventricosum]RWW56029.1 hypothetical protein BHE74_00037312 [Ensete ventricosum]
MAAAASASSPTPHAAVTERRGIPGASFVEDVETYLNQSGLDANSSLAFLQERFFLMLVQAKIPDIEKCLDVVATLEAKKGTGEVRFK